MSRTSETRGAFDRPIELCSATIKPEEVKKCQAERVKYSSDKTVSAVEPRNEPK